MSKARRLKELEKENSRLNLMSIAVFLSLVFSKVALARGYIIDGQATEILRRGCDDFIQKPFNTHWQRL